MLEVIEAPGHSPGHVCLYCRAQDFLIGGDVLFRDSIGRTDLPGGNFAQLAASIRNRLYTLPDRTVVYPGHGPSTTIGYEKQHNPFVKTEA
jgi:glyoxylase-like metal-dependent hydrolase (beta-lactamase superfamily II)